MAVVYRFVRMQFIYWNSFLFACSVNRRCFLCHAAHQWCRNQRVYQIPDTKAEHWCSFRRAHRVAPSNRRHTAYRIIIDVQADRCTAIQHKPGKPAHRKSAVLSALMPPTTMSYSRFLLLTLRLLHPRLFAHSRTSCLS